MVHYEECLYEFCFILDHDLKQIVDNGRPDID